MNDTEPRVIATDYSNKWRTLLAVMAGTFIAPLDGSIVNTILPSFAKTFQTEISVIQWVPTIYLLTVSCLILLFGRLGDMIGHKTIFLTGLISFTVVSLFCGLSQNIEMLIVFRGFQGLAGSMFMAVGAAIVTNAFPPQERGKALGTFSTSIAVALAAGPTMGGFITEFISWRFVFFINVPIGLIAVFFGWQVIPKGVVAKDQQLDWLGAVAAFVFLFSLLLYVNRANSWGWFSPMSLALIAVAVIFGYAFIKIENNTPQPMLNLNLFRNQIFTLGNISLLLHFIVAFTMIFLIPFYLTMILNLPISTVGIIMATYPLVMLVISPLAGTISDYTGPRWLTCSGMLICTFSLVALSRLTENHGIIDVVWRLLVFSFGMSMFQSPNSSAVMGSVPKKYLGIASGILANMRNLGMVLGIALSSTIFFNIAPAALSKRYDSFSAVEVTQLLNGFYWAFVVGAAVSMAAMITAFFAGKTPELD